MTKRKKFTNYDIKKENLALKIITKLKSQDDLEILSGNCYYNNQYLINNSMEENFLEENTFVNSSYKMKTTDFDIPLIQVIKNGENKNLKSSLSEKYDSIKKINPINFAEGRWAYSTFNFSEKATDSSFNEEKNPIKTLGEFGFIDNSEDGYSYN